MITIPLGGQKDESDDRYIIMKLFIDPLVHGFIHWLNFHKLLRIAHFWYVRLIGLGVYERAQWPKDDDMYLFNLCYVLFMTHLWTLDQSPSHLGPRPSSTYTPFASLRVTTIAVCSSFLSASNECERNLAQGNRFLAERGSPKQRQ